MQLTNTRPG